MSTKENIRIFNADEETINVNLSYDGKNIYICNVYGALKGVKKKCWVIDSDGKVVNVISCDNILTQYFGDDKFMFGIRIGSSMATVVYLDKSKIESVNEWTAMDDSAYR